MSKDPQLLADLATEVDEGFIEDIFDVRGHKYKLRLLSDGETNWKNRYIDALTSALSILSQRKSATLAVAIREIDGQDVEDLYIPKAPTDSSDLGAKAEYDAWQKLTVVERQFEVAKKLYNWLSKRPDDFTRDLYEKFTELEKRREEVIKNLKN